MSALTREPARDYAQRRANETRRAYFVSGWIDDNGQEQLRVLVDHPHNRRVAAECGDTFAETFNPQRRARKVTP